MAAVINFTTSPATGESGNRHTGGIERAPEAVSAPEEGAAVSVADRLVLSGAGLRLGRSAASAGLSADTAAATVALLRRQMDADPAAAMIAQASDANRRLGALAGAPST